MKSNIESIPSHKGCGKQIHIIGTQAGSMACEGMLRNLKGELTPRYCPDCMPSQPDRFACQSEDTPAQIGSETTERKL
jgi:hypothetical protein